MGWELWEQYTKLTSLFLFYFCHFHCKWLTDTEKWKVRSGVLGLSLVRTLLPSAFKASFGWNKKHDLLCFSSSYFLSCTPNMLTFCLFAQVLTQEFLFIKGTLYANGQQGMVWGHTLHLSPVLRLILSQWA